MGSIILVTGGARSGKSAIAESRTLVFGSPAVYVATAQALDAEMAQRIAVHQARRGAQWRTHAEPLDLCGALALTDGAPRLVDCLTLWLTNLILAERDRTADLGDVHAPALVIHGQRDRVIQPSGGRATAAALPDAELLELDRMGHDLPRWTWPAVIDGISRTAARAGSG